MARNEISVKLQSRKANNCVIYQFKNGLNLQFQGKNGHEVKKTAQNSLKHNMTVKMGENQQNNISSPIAS